MLKRTVNFGDTQGKLFRGELLVKLLEEKIKAYTDSLVEGNISWDDFNTTRGRIYGLREFLSTILNEDDLDEI